MIAHLVAALLAISFQTAPEVPSDDVVVIGERLRHLRLVTKTDRKTGVVRCVFKRSSGDPAFDARMCEATRICGATARTAQAMQACLTPYVNGYGEELKRRREAAAAVGK
ncbi:MULTISPECIES: hypothetical protein [unclassified Sphingomonas]|uniref:hypothetical protein n=1 Tax=unclassified Sphingomonas TaxID=196159 RepID=UPI0022699DD0|nr:MULTISPECIES: hypothetical protein [unclassified Sphingomonas]